MNSISSNSGQSQSIYATEGLKRQLDEFSKNANEVAQASTGLHNSSLTAEDASGDLQHQSQQGFSQSNSNSNQVESMAKPLVENMEIQNNIEAQAQVLRTADDMMGTIINIKA